MFFSTHHQALVRAVLTGVVTVAGLSACSRSDRTEAGRDSLQTGTAVTPSDTGTASRQSAIVDSGVSGKDTSASAVQAAPSAPSGKPSNPPASTRDRLGGDHGVSGYRAMAKDTSADTARETIAATDSAATGKPGERIAAAETSGGANDTLAAVDSAGIRPPEDSTELLGRASNDSAASTQPMARDTSTLLAQADTAGYETQPADTATTVDTATQVTQGDSSQVQGDTVALSVSVDTTTAQAADTMAQAGEDSSTFAQADTTAAVESTDTLAADTLAANEGQIRPTEDSTEVLGQVTPEQGAADTLPGERDRIRTPEDSTELYGQVNGNRAKVEADGAEVGAAPVEPSGKLATGADAVALMTRQGETCRVKDPETSRDAQWDFAASPATLNPCGTGTMTLPRIQTGEEK